MSRIQPAGPPEAYRTYGIRMPRLTHWRAITCEEAECEHWRQGWITRIDTSTELGVRQARYITTRCGRRYDLVEKGTVVEFTFPAGQKCFREHKELNDRPSIYVTRRGDWRTAPDMDEQLEFNEWSDRFRAATELLADRIRRG